MTVDRVRLHQLVDALPERGLDTVHHMLRGLLALDGDPVLNALLMVAARYWCYDTGHHVMLSRQLRPEKATPASEECSHELVPRAGKPSARVRYYRRAEVVK